MIPAEVDTILTPGAPERPAAGAPFHESAASGTADGPCHQPWCSAEVPAGASRCPRCNVWQPANSGALRDGVRRFETRGVLPADLRVSVDDFRDQVVLDQGGLGELSAIRSAYIRRLVDLETCARLLMRDFATHGVLTERGRVRASFDRFLALTDRWDRLASKLGMERRSRNVTGMAAVEQYAREKYGNRDQDA